MEWLKDARKAAGMTREEFMKRAEVSPRAVEIMVEFEADPPLDKHLSNIARVLSIDPDKAFYAAGQIPPWLREKLLEGGPALWRELRKDFFGRENK